MNANSKAKTKKEKKDKKETVKRLNRNYNDIFVLSDKEFMLLENNLNESKFSLYES